MKFTAFATVFRLLGLATVLALPATSAFGNDGGDTEAHQEIYELNNALLSEQAHRVIEDAMQRRATLLSDVIEHDPRAAASLSLPRARLEALRNRFPHLSHTLETHGPFRGELQIVVADDFERRQMRREYFLESGQIRYRLFFTDRVAADLQAGGRYEVQGIALGNRVAASDTTMQTQAALTVSSLGEQRTIALLVNFTDHTSQTISVSTVQSHLFGASNSVDAYWREVSYGKTFATGDVRGWYTLPMVKANACDYWAVRDAAIQAADPFVYFPDYTRIFVVIPNNISCGWGGRGQTGPSTLTTADGTFSATTSWIITDSLYVFAHEGGHNLGMMHANLRRYTNSAGQPAVNGPLGTWWQASNYEYGDPFDTMGTRMGHHNAPHKGFLNWFDPANVQIVDSSGTYVLAPLSSASTGLQALRIWRGAIADNLSEWFWVETRRSTGFDTGLPGTAVYNGATIHHEETVNGNFRSASELLDMTPSTSTADDAPLPVGTTWTDPFTGIAITPESQTGGNLTVRVDYPALAVIYNKPDAGATYLNPIVANVRATFSREMDPATINNNTFTLSDGINTITGTISCALPCFHAYLNLSSPLAYATTYTATVRSGGSGVRAQNGAVLAADYTWSFTTTPEPPVVVATDPPADATGIPVLPTVRVTFNKAMDPATFTSSNFQLYGYPYTLGVPATFSCNNPCTQPTLRADVPLTNNVLYTISVQGGSTGPKDVAGTPMTGGFIARFRTRELAAGGPDLTVSALSAPTFTQPNTNISVSNSLTNQGATTAATITVDLYLSADAAVTRADTYLGSRTIAGLAAGVTNSANTTVTIPASAAEKTWYIGAIVDGTDAIHENNESNNISAGNLVSVTQYSRDLIMTAVSTTATSVRRGGKFSLTNTVKNLGSSSAPSFYIGFVLSPNNIGGDTDDIETYSSRSVNSLAAGKTSSAKTNVTTQGSMATGSYYICAEADSFRQIVETNENNNWLCSTSKINVTN